MPPGNSQPTSSSMEVDDKMQQQPEKEFIDYTAVGHMGVHPRYLEVNSSTHSWVLGAFAELIDNAQDPDCNASNLFIDVEWDEAQMDPRIVLTDDGKGCTRQILKKMLSLGVCDKPKDPEYIGRYGNGFKSGTMRIGHDVMVFTKRDHEMSVGFLSRTFLDDRGAQEVYVPIVTWILPEHPLFHSCQDEDNPITHECRFHPRFIRESRAALVPILEYNSFCETVQDLLANLATIRDHGTTIVICALRRTEGDGILELDMFESPDDIRISKTRDEQGRLVRYARARTFNEHLAEPLPIDYSLRAYCEILYIHHRVRITLRGKVVRLKRVKSMLKSSWQDSYAPRTVLPLDKASASIVFGLNPNPKPDEKEYGVLLYHHGRLIKSYVKLGPERTHIGRNVIGVVEADFLTPTHNKQDFDLNKLYHSLMQGLFEKLKDYWNEKIDVIIPTLPSDVLMSLGIHQNTAISSQPAAAAALQGAATGARKEAVKATVNWAMCDRCGKWRKLPASVSPPTKDDYWTCSMNTGHKGFTSSCNQPEDQEDAIERKTLVRKRKPLMAVVKPQPLQITSSNSTFAGSSAQIPMRPGLMAPPLPRPPNAMAGAAAAGYAWTVNRTDTKLEGVGLPRRFPLSSTTAMPPSEAGKTLGVVPGANHPSATAIAATTPAKPLGTQAHAAVANGRTPQTENSLRSRLSLTSFDQAMRDLRENYNFLQGESEAATEDFDNSDFNFAFGGRGNNDNEQGTGGAMAEGSNKRRRLEDLLGLETQEHDDSRANMAQSSRADEESSVQGSQEEKPYADSRQLAIALINAFCPAGMPPVPDDFTEEELVAFKVNDFKTTVMNRVQLFAKKRAERLFSQETVTLKEQNDELLDKVVSLEATMHNYRGLLRTLIGFVSNETSTSFEQIIHEHDELKTFKDLKPLWK